MNKAAIIKANDVINCTLISALRNFLPLGDNPKLPFNTSAGGNEVT